MKYLLTLALLLFTGCACQGELEDVDDRTYRLRKHVDAIDEILTSRIAKLEAKADGFDIKCEQLGKYLQESSHLEFDNLAMEYNCRVGTGTFSLKRTESLIERLQCAAECEKEVK